jgi:hypothetical protein
MLEHHGQQQQQQQQHNNNHNNSDYLQRVGAVDSGLVHGWVNHEQTVVVGREKQQHDARCGQKPRGTHPKKQEGKSHKEKTKGKTGCSQCFVNQLR